MNTVQRVFLENKAWVLERLSTNPSYFIEMAKDQTPAYLWIGCSDSRVLPNEITGTSVGEMFVHRNIANLVHGDDRNLMSVVSYAVQYLKIKHIIVCGHYGCGGVKASMGDGSFGDAIDGWLKNIKSVIHDHQELKKLPSETEQFDRLVELNVIQQIKNLLGAPTMKTLIENNQGLNFYGWVYDLKTGYLKDLIKHEA